MNIQVITDEISTDEVRKIAKEFYTTMIKGVVDIEREIIVLGGEYHMDANVVLLEKGSKQKDVWGFNINLNEPSDSDQWIEYISLINIRPLQNNRSMEIQDENIKRKVRHIITKKIK